MKLLLEDQELYDLGSDLRARTICCRSGRCWLTLAGDSRDHILHEGERMVVRLRGRVVVMALGAAELQLTAAMPEKNTLPWFGRDWLKKRALLRRAREVILPGRQA